MQIAGSLGFRFDQRSSVHGKPSLEAEVDEELLLKYFAIMTGDAHYVKVPFVLSLYWLQRADISIKKGIKPADFFKHALY